MYRQSLSLPLLLIALVVSALLCFLGLIHPIVTTVESFYIVDFRIPFVFLRQTNLVVKPFLTIKTMSTNGDNDGGNVSNEQKAVNSEWNEMAGDWDDLASGYSQQFISKLWTHTGLSSTTTNHRIIVDFGCGTGLLTERMMKAELQQSADGSSSISSKFVCIDAAQSMINVLQDKIRAGEWKNVRAYCAVLASPKITDNQDFERLKGTVDLVVASSVMSFIPKEELQATMSALASFLKPGGVFCHSDWPLSDDNPTGFTEEKATSMYEMGGLQKKSSSVEEFDMGAGQKGDVYIGVAVKPTTTAN